MPKIRVTMEAEIGDLLGYWPDNPSGVTSQNVFSLLKDLACEVMLRRMDELSKGETSVALKQAYQDDRRITNRLLDTFQCDVLP